MLRKEKNTSVSCAQTPEKGLPGRGEGASSLNGGGERYDENLKVY